MHMITVGVCLRGELQNTLNFIVARDGSVCNRVKLNHKKYAYPIVAVSRILHGYIRAIFI